MKKQIVRISILQSSKIATILYFLLGFLYLLIGAPMVIFGNNQLRIMGIIYCAMPILMAVIGFVCFVIFAALYNLIAKWVGGMEFEMIDIPEGQTTAGADTEEEVLI
jgi:hypothetical protein